MKLYKYITISFLCGALAASLVWFFWPVTVENDMNKVLTQQDSVVAVRATNEALIDSIQGFKDSINVLLKTDKQKEVVVIRETNDQLKELTHGKGQVLDSTIKQIKKDLRK